MIKTTIPWVNPYLDLPKKLYALVDPSPVTEPKIKLMNKDLIIQLGLNIEADEVTGFLAGNHLKEGDRPMAQAYGGHQFGHFNILGDGRAILLGQFRDPDQGLWNLQLKGAGPTPYSRRGDGRGTLSSMYREYLISEAMFHLGIPTTRSLAVIGTGDLVRRTQYEPGGILCRLSQSYVRVGTFQYAAVHGLDHVKALADYMIHHHFKDLDPSLNPYEALFQSVLDRQAHLIASWQALGFIHGVMNTDNMSVIGETIDYGPCAFMDDYHPNTVFSAIDTQGRYAYKNQPNMALWNLSRLVECLYPLFEGDKEEQIKKANDLMDTFGPAYNKAYYEKMSKKIGLKASHPGDMSLIQRLLSLMVDHKLDYTNTFMVLSSSPQSLPAVLADWTQDWLKRLEEEHSYDQAKGIMQVHNPWIIPRNHQVDLALREAVSGNTDPLDDLNKALQAPYDYKKLQTKYTQAPRPHERVLKTYCNT